LKLKCDEPLSKIAFKFNLHRYSKMGLLETPTRVYVVQRPARDGGQDCDFPDKYSQANQCQAGAYTRPLLSAT
jgi:hypothetical protein